MRLLVLRALTAATLTGLVAAAPAAGSDPAGPTGEARRRVPVIRVDAGAPGPRVTPYMTGVNNRFGYMGEKVWGHPAVVDQVVERLTRAGIRMVRYPGGTAGNWLNWKDAIGPRPDRGCQLNGETHGPTNGRYGPDEHMALLDRANAEAQLMAPFLNGSAGEAGDWVEYMNDPLGGKNPDAEPHDGVNRNWARVRAENGHQAPYGVTRWEVGNEPFVWFHRHWMPQDYSAAMRAYTFGGTFAQSPAGDQSDAGSWQRVGKHCSHWLRAARSTGEPAQRFTVLYGPVARDRIRVRVSSGKNVRYDRRSENYLSTQAGPNEPVFAFDPASDTIMFGTGRQNAAGSWQGHGRIPPSGVLVEAQYKSGRHDGFADYFRAMKRVDRDIDVCSAWGRAQWLAYADRRDVRYDCVVSHPFRIFKDPWGSRGEAYAQMMRSRGWVKGIVADLRSGVRRHRPSAYVAVSEYGAIAYRGVVQPGFENWKGSLMRAMFNVTQLLDLTELGVPWVEGGMMRADDTRSVVRGPEGYRTAYSALAVSFEALKSMYGGRGRVVRNAVVRNRVVDTPWGDFGALVVSATKDRHGRLNLVVVNRHPERKLTAKVITKRFAQRGGAALWRVRARSFGAFNSVHHPNLVKLQAQRERLGRGDFRMAFPAHSITRLLLRPS